MIFEIFNKMYQMDNQIIALEIVKSINDIFYHYHKYKHEKDYQISSNYHIFPINKDFDFKNVSNNINSILEISNDNDNDNKNEITIYLDKYQIIIKLDDNDDNNVNDKIYVKIEIIIN